MQRKQTRSFESSAIQQDIPWDVTGTQVESLSDVSPDTSLRTKKQHALPRLGRKVTDSGEDGPTKTYRASSTSEPNASRENFQFFGNRLDDHLEGEGDVGLHGRRSSKDSTITVSEMRAFNNIFDTIKARNEADSRFAEQGDGKSSGTSHKPRTQGLDLQGQTRIAAQDKIHKALQKYPAALRSTAADALQAYGTSAELATEPIEESNAELESMRRPERERITALLSAAPSDTDLWQILEREVFPLVSALGLAASPESTTKSSSATNNVDNPTNGPQLDIRVYGALYPALLLLAHRLLTRSFARPSALAHQLLPRIKALGPASHALGASTALYNEELALAWSGSRDVWGSVELLSEMDASGVGFDGATLRLLNGAFAEQNRVAAGDAGEALRVWWRMSGINAAMPALGRWRAKVVEALTERRAGVEEERRLEAEEVI
jgi:hypothetical protein